MTWSGGGAPHSRQVLGRVRVADQRRVVAPDDRAVQRRADAFVGLRADHDEPADPEAGEHALQRGLLERVARRPSRSAARHRPGPAPATICQSSLPARSSPSCCTQTTGTCSRRALSTRLPTLATTASRSCAPPTTPFCTSMTSSAVLGRPSSVVMLRPSPVASDSRPPHRQTGRGEGDSPRPARLTAKPADRHSGKRRPSSGGAAGSGTPPALPGGGRLPDGSAHHRMEVVGELGAGEGVLVGSVERRARKRRVVLGELKPTRVQQEPDHVGCGVGLAGQLIHHPGIVEARGRSGTPASATLRGR